MSNVVELHDASEETHVDAHTGHPSDIAYIKIAAILAALTMIEVLTYTFDMKGGTLLAVLLPIMIIKFGIVAGYFMHLKFDSRMFTGVFVAGLLFAVGLYCVVLATFRFW